MPYADFDDFLAGLQRDKRKKIAQERRQVADAGVVFEAREGPAIAEADWDFFHRCYSATYRAHHSTPYLTRGLLQRRSRPRWRSTGCCSSPARWPADRRVADRVDPASGVAFGRYWGATEYVHCLHFEACYYQPLAWCIAQGYRALRGRRAGRAQDGARPDAGAHRARRTGWRIRPSRCAVARFLEREGAGIEAYVDELEQRSPFRATPP